MSDDLAHHLPVGCEGRDEGAEHDEAGFRHQLRDLADAADIFDAVGEGKAEIFVQPVADVVAVEQNRVHAAGIELLFDEIGDRRFAGAGEAGEPEDRGALMLQSRPLRFGDGQILRVDIGRPLAGRK